MDRIEHRAVTKAPQVRRWDMQLALLAVGTLGLVGYIWFALVQKHVPEAYLDEVFHVRQAEAYWNNQWTVWDPKITTPPGLYICGYVWLWIHRIIQSPWTLTVQLRSLNLSEGLILYPIFHSILRNGARKEGSTPSRIAFIKMCNHTALNLCLFPPLFFFYALYYTDILSAGLVLLSYRSFLAGMTKTTLVLSLIALSFRQTNIFWIAVFLGGFEVVRNIQQGRLGVDFPLHPTFHQIVMISWRTGRLYDPLVDEGCFEDYLKCGISLVMASLANPRKILTSLLPFVSSLGIFGAFVLWNGGVVLGDKSNHTATIHASQILYIWPYFTFFSLPLLYPHFLALIPRQLLPSLLRSIVTHIPRPRLTLAIPICLLMTAVVHYNTIVHPFTLADNRHYTFYAFRLLLWHPSIRYSVVPIYFICAWATVLSFGGIADDPKSTLRLAELEREGSNRKTRPESRIESEKRCSFVLIWFLSTSLSLITAPLVEPRYFIIPWLIWRLHLPTAYDPSRLSLAFSSPQKLLSKRLDTPKLLVFESYDHRLWLETIWFLIINAVTGYIFLYWGFIWEQEPGKVQRFMW